MILFGLLIGVFLFLVNISAVVLTPDIFFLILLPPIIMEAGLVYNFNIGLFFFPFFQDS